MHNLFKIALRNLLRYKRRTLLTASLIVLGVVFVLVFVSVTGSFKIHDDRPDHRLHARPPAGAPQGLRGLHRQPAPQPEHQGRRHRPAGKDLGRRARDRGLFAADQVRRHVQHLCGDHEHPLKRHRPGAGDGHRPPPGRPGPGREKNPGPRRTLDSGAARQRDEGQGRGYGGHRRHQPGRLGERQAVPGRGHPGECHRSRAAAMAICTSRMPRRSCGMEGKEISEFAVRLKDFDQLAASQQPAGGPACPGAEPAGTSRSSNSIPGKSSRPSSTSPG